SLIRNRPAKDAGRSVQPQIRGKKGVRREASHNRVPFPPAYFEAVVGAGAGAAAGAALGRLICRTDVALGNIDSSNSLPLSIFVDAMKTAALGSACGAPASIARPAHCASPGISGNW